jgi:CDP-paratose 2-epimerase
VSRAGWRPSDQKVYVSDIRRARDELGWQPRIGPDEGVRDLIAWVREHREVFTA